MIESSTLFEHGPLPPSCQPNVIHVKGVPRPSPLFTTLQLLCEHKPKNKNGGGLGTRLESTYFKTVE